jgi:hypothetical protein
MQRIECRNRVECRSLAMFFPGAPTMMSLALRQAYLSFCSFAAVHTSRRICLSPSRRSKATHLRPPVFLLMSLLLGLTNTLLAQSGNVVINTPTTWPSGVYNLTSLTVTGGATLTLQGANTTGQVSGQWAGQGVTINATNVQVDSGSAISADGQGYVGVTCAGNASGAGPGGGPYNCNNNGNGGSYGGLGTGPNTSSVATYGSSLTPTDLGSGGAGGWQTWPNGPGQGGNGGGAIRLIVSGTVTNNGIISANGAGGQVSTGAAGSGSGGSVYVTTSTLAGSGVFQANGGQTVIPGTPSTAMLGGGGGRVAIYYHASSYTGFTTSTATGGANTSGGNAGDGTIGFFDTSQANNRLYVYKLFSLAPSTTATYDSITVENAGTLTIGGGSAIAVTNTVTVTGNSTILLQGVNVSAQVSGQWQGQGVAITATNLQVDAGSTISANGQGYAGNSCSGPGAGPGGGPLNCNNNGNGGSYGGQGGGPNPGTTYGSALAPTALGSGGSGGYGLYQGSGQGLGGAGGGSIRLVVSGTLTDNGTISANGSTATQNAGGGSGGSIYVTAGTLAGSGIFTANGGVVAATATGGGGGRIAVYYANYGNYGGFQTSTANGSSGGGPGSAFFVNTTTNDLLVSGGQTLALSTSSAITYDNIAVQDGANLVVIDGGSTLNVNGTFTVTGNSTVLLQSQNNTAQVGGQWQGQGVTINATNLQVDAGSTISAAGQGYAGNNCAGPGVGPGGGPLNCNNNGNGGSYGGKGGGPNVASMVTYGSAFAPTDLGSGGSGGYGLYQGSGQGLGGAGGGAIRLVVSGALTDNGTISANGSNASQNGGGGSGGSIYVTTGTIAGSGIFTANGGSTGDNPVVEGGGGGRIAIYYTTNSAFNPAVSMTANAGGTTAGQQGSLVFVNSTNNDLLIPGGRLETSQNSTLSFNNITIENSASVIMDGGSTLNAAATLTVTGTSSLVVGSKNNTVQISGQWQGAGGTINAANVQVDSGSVIGADGQGYVGNNCSGPGAGPGGGPLNCNNNGNGGSYGGQGGGPNPGTTYGLASAPSALGSGGSGGYGIGAPGGAGGGAVSLVVSGTLTDNGTITANGAGAQANAGGGSGGSIYVTTGTLAGNGTINANGGSTGSNTGGGGGRVDIYYGSCTTSFNRANVTASGGGAGAGAGTVIFGSTTTLTWAAPAAITYGTALSATQLNATASVPCTSTGVAGTFVYNPATGTVLTVGTQTLSVTFTPTDTNDYSAATASVSLRVNRATPAITWAAPAAITYGTALSATQLNATTTVAGTFAYSPVAGTVLAVGTQTLSVTFTPTDTTDYTTATASVSLRVNQVTPAITWAAPAAITYGTALSATQLNATASVPGTFAYSPVAGTVLTAGTQTLSVTFTPTDTTDYTAATASVSLRVNQATPAITWAVPTAITYGTALSATQLNATASVPGTFAYSPVAGTVLAAGTQTLSVTFTPTDTTDYTTATAHVLLTVNKATLTVTAASPTITYGQTLPTYTATYSGFQNGDTSSVLSGSPSLTTTPATPSAANTYAITAAAGSLSAANYTFTFVNGTLTINKAVLTVTAASPTITYGQTLPTYTATYSGYQNGDTSSVLSGSPSLTTTPATPSAANTYTITAAVGSLSAANYTFTFVNGTLTINKATPAVSATSSANSVFMQNPVTLTATVSSAAGSPTGTVTFQDGGVALSQCSVIALTSGVASCTISTMSAASHSITVAYSGDANFLAATSSALTEAVGDFTITAPGASVTATAGGTAGYTINVSPASGASTFPAAVTLSVSGLPTGATYTFTPASLAAGASATNVTLTIQLPQTMAATQPDRGTGGKLASRLAPFALALMLLPFAGRMRKSGRRFSRVLSVLLLSIAGMAAMAGLSGCSSNTGFYGQQQTSYTLTVTATSGALSHSTTVALTVETIG